MNILWTEFAEWNLKDIYLYHKKVGWCRAERSPTQPT